MRTRTERLRTSARYPGALRAVGSARNWICLTERTYLFLPRTRVSARVTAIRRFFSSWLLADSAARASSCPGTTLAASYIPIAATILTSLSNSTNAKPFERPLSSRIIRTSLTAPYCPPTISPHAQHAITVGGTHRLEQALEVLLRDELAEASDVNLAIVRVAVRALLLPLRVGDQHRELAALFHVCTIQLQRSLRGRLANRGCQSPCSH